MPAAHTEPANEYQYDVVMVLGGGLHKDSGVYRPTTFEHGDEYGMLGGAIRVPATVGLYEHRQANTFLFSNGVSAKQVAKFGPDVPAEAPIYRDAFLHDISKPAPNPDLEPPVTVLEANSPNTVSGIVEAMKIIAAHGWKHIAVVTSDYHVPRVAALWRMVETELGQPPADVDVLSAEKLVKDFYPGVYDADIAAAYDSPLAKLRLQNEANGLRDMREGRYVLHEFQLAKK